MDNPQSIELNSTRQDYAIRARNIGKAYPQYPTLFGMAAELITKQPYHTKKWVLQDVSFDIARGEVVGIVGSNGAGKSTLLRILAGLLDPTTGTFDIRGRLSAILELGTGFDGDYTGRENVITGGLCVGMTREEIDAKLQWVIDFSELESVIDEPFRTYSSGMKARLTFATAICGDPEVLIVDEALAAGDSFFVAKCFRRIREICRSGATVLFVSHGTSQVAQLCNRAIWLEKGLIREIGPAPEVSKHYDYEVHVRISEGLGKVVDIEESANVASSDETAGQESNEVQTHRVFRKGPPIIEDVRILGANGKSRRTFVTWEPLTVEVEYSCPAEFIPIDTLGLAVAIERESDLALIWQISTANISGNEGVPYGEADFRKAAGTRGILRLVVPQLQMLNGTYLLSVGIGPNVPNTSEFYEYRHRTYKLTVLTTGYPSGAAFYPIVEWSHEVISS